MQTLVAISSLLKIHKDILAARHHHLYHISCTGSLLHILPPTCVKYCSFILHSEKYRKFRTKKAWRNPFLSNFHLFCKYCSYYSSCLWTPAHAHGDGQTSWLYSSNPVLHLYISCYVTTNKPELSYTDRAQLAGFSCNRTKHTHHKNVNVQNTQVPIRNSIFNVTITRPISAQNDNVRGCHITKHVTKCEKS